MPTSPALCKNKFKFIDYINWISFEVQFRKIRILLKSQKNNMSSSRLVSPFVCSFVHSLSGLPRRCYHSFSTGSNARRNMQLSGRFHVKLFSGDEILNDSPPSVARISTPRVSNSTAPLKGPRKNIKNDSGNIIASPVLRPRAVLSSPNNDGMIGNINDISSKRPSVTKKNDLPQKGTAQDKIKQRSTKTANPMHLTNDLDSGGMIGNQISSKRPLVMKKHDSAEKGSAQDKIKPKSIKIANPSNSTNDMDNSRMIGNTNQISSKKPSVLKKHYSAEKMTAQCKIRVASVKTDNPSNLSNFDLDNGGMIGNENRVSSKRPVVIKNPDLTHKGTVEVTTKPTNLKTANPVNSTKVSKDINIKVKQGLEPTVAKQKLYLRKEKPNTTGV